MERKVGVVVCCLLVVVGGALPAMGNGWPPDAWEGPMTVMYHVTSEPGEGVLIEQWANQHLAQATPFDGDGTATWQFVGYYPYAIGGVCLSGAPMWLHAPLVVPSGDGALIFHHWDDHDPGVNTAYYQFCLSGEVTAHYQFLSSGVLFRTLHLSLVCPDAQCNCYHPDLSVSAQVDPPDYYGISSRSMAYGGADFLYLGSRASPTVSVPYAMQSPEGRGRRFDHWEGLPPGSLLSGPLHSTVKLELLQNAEIAAVYIAPGAAVVPDKTSFPTAMVPGRWYQATVTMKNTGTDTWTKADGYGLVCRDTPPELWTTTQVPLDDGDAIAPGQEKTFRFLMRAPQQPGSYLPHWSMGIGDVTFGETTTQPLALAVGACTPAVSEEEVIYRTTPSDHPPLTALSPLFRYDRKSGTTTQITRGDTNDSSPEISGDRVAYMSWFADDHWAVSVLDLTSGTIQQFDPHGQQLSGPDIDGRYVVWTSTDALSQTHLFLLDVVTREVTYLEPGVGPARVDGGRIAYVKTSAGLLRIYDIAQGRVIHEFPCTGTEVDISGDKVAAIADGQIVLFDLAAGTRTQLTGASGHQVKISDGRIVWTECCSIVLYDIATGTRVTLAGYSCHQPGIAGESVVWGECWIPTPTVYLLDLSRLVSVAADAGTGFPDVPVGYWAYDGVMACSKADIVGGYDDGLYHPELSVTRDQMAVYIARALVSPSGDAAIPDGPVTPNFPDVSPEFWAYRQIEYAVSQNVVEGYEDGTYQPASVVDRGQMAVYLARAMVAPGGDAAIPDPVPPATFPDVPDTFWAYKHVEYCVEHGVVEGYDDGYYHPEIVVTRDQMAVYIARAFGLLL
jgi:hypothetical protein